MIQKLFTANEEKEKEEEKLFIHSEEIDCLFNIKKNQMVEHLCLTRLFNALTNYWTSVSYKTVHCTHKL